MFRAVLISGAVLGAVLVPAQSANANHDDICVSVTITGQVPFSTGPHCQNYTGGIQCHTPGAGRPGQLYAEAHICIPKIVG